MNGVNIGCGMCYPVCEMVQTKDPSLLIKKSSLYGGSGFPLSLPEWCNKGCGMCYDICEMMHIKEPLLLIGKSSPCGGSGFPLSLSEWCNKGCGMCYPIWGCVYKRSLAANRKK